MLLSFRVSESCMSKLWTNYDLYCKLSGLLNHQCSEQKWLSVGSFYIDEGTKSSLLPMFEVLTAPGAARTIPTRELPYLSSWWSLCYVLQARRWYHNTYSQWIQTDAAVKKGLRTQIMNEDVIPCEQFCSLDKWNGSSVMQCREEHNQPSICSTDTQHINWLISHCIFLDVI